ncbi:MAG TPA: DUF4192 domain-containing protein [Candidatus Nanopelagicales bacterium]|nr:DUF4192 domain-containing protein [Candidatus Nanopelagicales bacterium]
MTRRTATAPARSADPTVLRVREPGDILGVIPYLLGFHPTDSLVAAFIRDRQVVVTARIDLAATADLEGLLDQLEMVAQRVATRSLVLVGYADDEGVRELMRDLADVIPLDLLDALAVAGDRWWSVACDGPCCPPEGRPYDIGSHPLAAAAVLAGIPATTTRQQIAELTAGPGTVDRERLGRLAEDWEARVGGMSRRRRRRRMRQVVERALAAGGPTEAEAVEIAVLARDVVVRDEACALMSRARGDEHVALWRRVVSVAVRPYEAAPLGMLAIAGWMNGNGALLNCCIDRLAEVAPDYSLLELCKDISEQAIAPSCFDAIASDLGAALD